MQKTCKVSIDKEIFEFDVKGEFFWGKEETLYTPEDSVISKTDWEKEGFSVVEAFTKEEFSLLKNSVKQSVLNAFKEIGLAVNEEEFCLEDYHKIINTNELHNQVINITRNFEVKDFDFDIEKLAKKFGNMLDYELTTWIEELKKTHIQVRISRPNTLDINPPHRDGYLSYWEDIINVWIPVAGTQKNTSLPMIPGSHYWSESFIQRTASKGAEINGNIYFVPCILDSKDGTLQMERPTPKEGEALLFTPFLVHGAAINQSKDVTRMSIELRLPKVK